MATVDGYKYNSVDIGAACSVCTFYTEKDWGEYDFPLMNGCPECGSKILVRKLYICPTCGKAAFGVDDLKWHIGYHG